jgi:modification methylase
MHRIICKSAECMAELAYESVNLVVTSPPYNVGKEYEIGQSWEEWIALLSRVFTEVMRVLVKGGRVAVNTASIGRKPYRPLHSYVLAVLVDLGFMCRGEIIWDKGATVGVSTAWGSYARPSNPVLRDVHETITIFSKDSWQLATQGPDTIDPKKFLSMTQSVWRIPTESAKRIGHPAPFPVELPRRLIQLYSRQGDLVLDPFCGAGTTSVAAVQTGRKSIGYDLDPAYCEIARARIQKAEEELARECSVPATGPTDQGLHHLGRK